MHERLRDEHAALHPARQRAHVRVGLLGQVEIGHHFIDPVVVATQPEIAGLDPQRLANSEERVEDEFLRHDAECAARTTEVLDDVVAAHRDTAFVGPGKPGEDADERGLACAVGAEQTEELAFLDRQADALERLKRFVALLDVTDFYG
ncbi:hypothetical protein VL15_35280 [Burkholderia cepacia]|uniref:Uncharacterized protein n=1 Tax=Burkholderia cepacia TaxID=292 RepID=A0A0J5W6Y5_BURCE|nr:hypothetical protein VL15_35280 [Burkholderia cepacia]